MNEISYLIRLVAGVPDWNDIPELEAGHALWLPSFGIRAFGQICYCADCLFVRLRAAEKEIRAEYTAPGSPFHQDSCLEFFFMREGAGRYFNFEINPNGCLHIGYGAGRENRTVVYPSDTDSFAVRTARTPDGWDTSYRIPLAFLRRFEPDFAFIGCLRANVYKCGDLTAHEHYLSWSPVRSETPDFHRPQDFGRMTFE